VLLRFFRRGQNPVGRAATKNQTLKTISKCFVEKTTVISTEVPTCRDEVEKSIQKQISRLAFGSLEMTF
jgi:hypothetical protein